MPIDETLLLQMERDIENELKSRRLSAISRRRLQIDRLQIVFMKDNIETKRKVDVMWTWFRPMAWVMSTATVAFIGILVTELLQK